jgi:hypothetical protein
VSPLARIAFARIAFARIAFARIDLPSTMRDIVQDF